MHISSGFPDLLDCNRDGTREPDVCRTLLIMTFIGSRVLNFALHFVNPEFFSTPIALRALNLADLVNARFEILKILGFDFVLHETAIHDFSFRFLSNFRFLSILYFYVY